MWAPAARCSSGVRNTRSSFLAPARRRRSAGLAPVPPLPLPPFDVWLAELRAEAASRGIRPDILDRALTGIEPVAQILERDRTQAEFTLDSTPT